MPRAQAELQVRTDVTSQLCRSWLVSVQEESGKLSGIVRSCVIYRLAQKRIARMYLQAARAALGEEMQRLRGTI